MIPRRHLDGSQITRRLNGLDPVLGVVAGLTVAAFVPAGVEGLLVNPATNLVLCLAQGNHQGGGRPLFLGRGRRSDGWHPLDNWLR